jgi:hypothetical protein
MFVIPNEEVEKLLENPSQLTQHLRAPRSEMVVNMPDAKATVSLQENKAWWDMIYVLSIQTMAN